MHKLLFYLIAIFPKNLRIKILNKIATTLLKRYSKVYIEGLENIPKDGQVIFICNHLSNIDGLMMKFLLENIKKIVFVAGVKLRGELITSLMLDIVPHISIHPNKPDRKALREGINTVKKGYSLFIFPEGTRSRTGKLLKGRSGVLLIAKHSNVPIIPIGLWGTEKLLPINQEGTMSKEWFNKAKVHIRIGKAFALDELVGEEEKIDLLMLRIAELLPEDYRGYYGEIRGGKA